MQQGRTQRERWRVHDESCCKRKGRPESRPRPARDFGRCAFGCALRHYGHYGALRYYGDTPVFTLFLYLDTPPIALGLASALPGVETRPRRRPIAF
jgi:hypothetical protein